MSFDNQNCEKWITLYRYAKVYYENHRNLNVPARFKTNNSYTYDENETVNLGQWIHTQRKKTTTKSERGKLLSQIGMIWNTEKNKAEISLLCAHYVLNAK